jgi:phospholipase/lecithinase/hemolysin
MLLRRLLTSALLLTGAICLNVAATAQAYTSIVVIGDSLSDTGNDTAVSTATYGPGAAVPAPISGYTQGRFTDGADTLPPATLYRGVWVEQLAAMLAAKPAVLNSLAGGSDYAYGFAFTGTGTTAFTYGPGNALSFPVNNMGLQLSTYLATSPTITSKTLFVIWGGANDLLNATSSAQITTAVTNELGIIQTLIAAGATDFLVVNLPPLGAVPRLNTLGATAVAATQSAAAFNAGLASGLAALPAANPSAKLHIFPLDVYTLFNNIIAAPTTYGFADIKDMSQLAAVNPDTYLFWDGLHPTTAGHHLIATTALALIAPSTTSTTVTSSNLAINQSASVTFTATVTSSSGIPPGVVTFYDGSNAIGTGQLSGGSPNTATFTTTSLLPGTRSITASYNQSMYFNASTSKAISEVVTAPAFSLALSPPSVTLLSGGSYSTNVFVTSVGGFAGTVALSCGALPANTRCVLSNTSLTFTGTNTALTTSLEIYGSTSASLLQPARPGTSSALRGILACTLLPLFGLAAFRRRFRRSPLRRIALLLMLFGATAFGLSGCGSNSSANKATPGAYTVPITATSGTATSTANLTVVIL